jgi:lipoyl(octanoyl) transferase
MQEVILKDLGLIDYKEAWDFQESLFTQVVAHKIKNRDIPEEERINPRNYFLFCEHPHVYTLGKSGSEDHLLLKGEELADKHLGFYRINRGGDITYHGPGQIVGYPIFDLDQFFTDIHKYLRFLEEAVIRTLQEYGIKAGRIREHTGVWIDEQDPARARKICAMGVRCSRWVTMHGFAFNVNPDLSYFGNIVPCGISDKAVTSMERELGYKVGEDEIKVKLRSHIAELFKISFVNDEL